MTPGTRRFKDQNKGSRAIGFRCAMIRMGAPTGNEGGSGHEFKTKKRRSRK